MRSGARLGKPLNAASWLASARCSAMSMPMDTTSPAPPQDPLPLAQALIRCPSVTPTDAGALDVLGNALARLGFNLHRQRFEEVENLYAVLRTGQGPNLCFAGHTDVVPVGDAAGWSHDPFGADVSDGMLWGRGAADMKAAIAAMVSGVETHLLAHGPPAGAISFLITADEEGPALHGTKRMLGWLKERGETIDHCLVGEPTSSDRFGDTVKNGRRGSLNAVITVSGKQGHVAYPEKSANPVPALLAVCQALLARKLDDGAPGFTPSNLEVTTLDVANVAHNVIPAKAEAKFNIRFNTAHTGEALLAWIEDTRAATQARFPGCTITIRPVVGAHPFYTTPCSFIDVIVRGVEATTGLKPELSTTGGTSDARFIKDICPVAEFGLLNETAHKVDEHVAVADVRTLAKVYAAIIGGYFAA
jgi:succinyl-diaminopimelate desuccinylase